MSNGVKRVMSEQLKSEVSERPTTFERLRSAKNTLSAGAIGFVLLAGCADQEAQVFRSTGEIVGYLADYDEQKQQTEVYWSDDESGLKSFEMLDSFPTAIYSAATNEAEDTLVGCQGAQDYEVQPGDTLHSITDENIGNYWGYIDQPMPYKESLVNIVADINEIAESDHIQAGETIIVPRTCDTERGASFQQAVESMQD